MEGGGPVGPHGDDAGAVPAPAEARSVVLVSASGEPSASVPPGPGRRDHLGPQPVRGPLSALAHLGILPCRPAAWGLVRTRPRQARLVPGAQSSCPTVSPPRRLLLSLRSRAATAPAPTAVRPVHLPLLGGRRIVTHVPVSRADVPGRCSSGIHPVPLCSSSSLDAAQPFLRPWQ